jgi:hypothetical protein
MPRFPDLGVHAVVDGYRDYLDKMGGMSRSTAETHSVLGRLGSVSLGGIVSSAGIAAVAIGAIGVAAAGAGAAIGAMLFKAAESAAPLFDIQQAFLGITANAGRSADEVLQLWQDASRGTIDATELMRNFNTATQLLGVTLAEQIPAVIPSIAKVAAATGQSVTQLTNDFIRGIGRESVMILDNLGITVDLGQVMEDYARTLGTTADQLTKNQRQTALLSFATAALEKNTAGIPDVADTAAGAFAMLRTTLRDTRDEILISLVPALLPMVKQFQELAKRHLPGLAGAITRVVIPAIGSVATWIGSHLGPAIDKAIRAWDFMTRTIQVVVGFWTGVLLPAIGKVGDAVSALLTPILERFGAWWEDTLIPALSLARTWLATNLPPAFGAVGTAVGGLFTALSTLWDFINANLVPVFRSVWDWISQKLQPAFDSTGVSAGGLATLILPLIGVIGSLATGNIPGLVFSLIGLLIPAFTILRPWLEQVLPGAIVTLQGWWDQLTTAIGEGAAFWTTTLQPALVDLWKTVSAQLGPAFETLALIWSDVVLPALKLVWQFLSVSILPAIMAVGDVVRSVLGFALRSLWAFIVDHFIPGLSILWTWISQKVGPVFEFLGDAIEAVGIVLNPVFLLMHDFAELVRNLEIPEWLKGHSPSPFENTLAGIRDTLLQISAIAGPTLGAGRLSPLAVASAGATSGGGDSFNPAYNLSIHTAARSEQVAADFGLMQALSRRR